MIQENFNYFKDNHDALFNLYPNKFLVIKDLKVLDVEDTMSDALSFVDKSMLKSGEYIIQLCTEGDSAYTSSFCSQIICG